MQFTFTLAEVKQAAQKLFKIGSAKKVWAFYGEMGVGKTTFIHALCENLRVTSTIGSPTYSIINEYISPDVGIIYHMDWYRLKGEEEALEAGVEDTLLSGNLCLVEWPEKAENLLPEDCLKVTISIVDEQTRQVSA